MRKKSRRESQGEVKANSVTVLFVSVLSVSVLFLPRLWFCYEDNGKIGNFTVLSQTTFFL